MNSSLFVSLLMAHVIADFYLQNDAYCQQKNDKKLKSTFLYVHSLLVGLVSWAFVPIAGFWLCALGIVVTHFLTDAVKSYTSNDLCAFTIDQLAHLAVLAVIAVTFSPGTATLPLQWLDCSKTIHIPLFMLSILLCIKPANIIIKLILHKYKIGINQSCEHIKNAGALIGNLERMLTVLFVILGQYEAIGFIIAAKSILRFRDTDTAKTEYVLAGTFLSFGIALLCGLISKYADY